MSEVAALPKTPDAFGPMHTDLHQHNLHWSDGALMIFDFEDMLDFWFVSDLAIILYYALLRPIWSSDLQADFERAYASVFEGYRRQHALPDWSIEALPMFMKLREHTLRAVSLRSVPVERRTERWWGFIDGATERIVKNDGALGLSFP